MSRQGKYFPQLTGIRAIAAYLIFIHHFTIPRIPNYVRQEFYLGVGFFFVLSGFLIYYRYADTFEGTKSEWIVYSINRVARIYPLYLVLSIIVLMAQSADAVTWITNLTFTRGFFDSLKFTGIAPGWSLTVEECFYFSAPLLFVFFRRNKFWLPLFAVYGIGLLLLLIGNVYTYQGFFGNFVFVATYTYFGRAFDFFIGMYLAKHFLAGNLNKQSDTDKSDRTVVANNFRQYANWAFTGLGWLIVLGTIISGLTFLNSGSRILRIEIFVVMMGLFIAIIPWLFPKQCFTFVGVSAVSLVIGLRILFNFHGIAWNTPPMIFINNIIYPVLFATILLGLLIEQSFISRFLSTRLMVLLGKASFAFYLIHMGPISSPILGWLEQVISNPYLSIGLHFVILNLISIGLFLFLEEPLNHFIRSQAAPWKKPTMQQAH